MDALYRRLPAIDIRWAAILVSCLYSLIVIAHTPVLNDDAFSYLKAAEVFSTEGLQATLSSYGWYGYSVLIAGLDSVLPAGLVTSAHLLNLLAFSLLVYAFITLAMEYSTAPAVKIFAAIVILCFSNLNEMRADLIRDFGYWGFCLTALVQLIRYNKTGRPIHACGWLCAMAAAIFFRLEGLLILAFSPLSLLLPGRVALRDRVRYLVIMYGLILVGALFVLALFFLAGINLPEIFSYAYRWYLPLLAEYPDTLHGAATNTNLSEHISEQLTGFVGKGYVMLFLGYLYAVIDNLAMALSPAVSLFLIFGFVTGKQEMTNVSKWPWLVFLCSSLLALLIFVSIMQFLTTRYAVMSALLLLTLMPLCLDALFRQAKQHGSEKRFITIAGLFVFYFTVDSLVSFGYSKNYIQEAAAWSRDNIAQGSTLQTNSFAVAYYSGLVDQYDDIETDTAVILPALARDDYLALELANNDGETREALAGREDLTQLARFANKRDDAVVIYRVTATP